MAPTPDRRPVTLEAHGDVRTDDWFWLRDKDDPAVIAHLEAENAYTAAVTAGTTVLQEALFAEMVARIEETDLSVPVRKGPWLYYGRTQEGSNYGIHCRRPVDGPEDVEQVLLDENSLAEGHDYFSLGNFSISPDHRWLVYSTDTTGGERYTMRFRDLVTGAESDESIEDTSYGVAWANDNATVFYVRVDEAMRPFQLWRHRVGADPAGDVLVIEEPDDHFYLGVGRTKDDCYVLCGLDSKVTSEVRILDADDPEGAFTVVEPRRQGIEYSVDHDRGDPASGRPGRFLVVTNDGAEDFRLMEAPDEAPGRDRWSEVIPARAGVRLDAVDPFVRHLAVYEREDGETRMRVVEHATGTPPRWPSPSRRRRCGERPTPSTTPPCSATGTRHSPPRGRPTTSTSTRVSSRCASASPSWGTSTPPATAPSAAGPPPMTARGFPSRSSTAGTWSALRCPAPSAHPACSMATGPTRRRWTPPSPPSASASSTGASCSPSPTCAAEASWAGTGTRRGSSPPSRTRSPTSWPAPGSSWPRAGRRRSGWSPAAAAPAAC